LIGSFITQVRQAHLLLVLLLSVYVNLVKELFLYTLLLAVFGTVFPKASAKVLLFHDMAKFFGDYFPKNVDFPGFDDENQGKLAKYGQYEQLLRKQKGIDL
jgi:hypothetical protein